MGENIDNKEEIQISGFYISDYMYHFDVSVMKNGAKVAHCILHVNVAPKTVNLLKELKGIVLLAAYKPYTIS